MALDAGSATRDGRGGQAVGCAGVVGGQDHQAGADSARCRRMPRSAGAHAGCPLTVTWAPVASVTRAAPNSRPGVHAPGLAPARTRRAVSAAMAAVAPTPSP